MAYFHYFCYIVLGIKKKVIFLRGFSQNPPLQRVNERLWRGRVVSAAAGGRRSVREGQFAEGG